MSQTTLPVAAQTTDHFHGAAEATVTLTYDQRFLRRKRLTTDAGEAFLVDLEQTTSVGEGWAFVLSDGRRVAVRAADEPLLRITAADLVRLAWHIGNRHCPCQLEPDGLIVQRDKVIADMAIRLGAEVTDITAAFTPEGGAYGLGRTHGHRH